MQLKKAFTLIELLVVIAIIAILAAILFPVFAQAKNAAKKASATSNLKQNALATIMYTNDNEGVFPQSAYTDDASKNGQFILPLTAGTKVYSTFDVIQAYTKNKDIFQDPADPEAIQWKGILAGANGVSPAGIVKMGVSINFTLFEDPGVPSPIGGGDPVRSESSLTQPADTVMFYSAGYTARTKDVKDRALYETGFLAKGGDKRYLNPVLPFGRHNFAGAPRHSGSIVINFADSSVRVKTATSALTGTVPDPANATKTLPVYVMPFDLNGIPDVIAEPVP